MKPFNLERKPTIIPPLDPIFSPIIVGNIAFEKEVKNSRNPVDVKIAIERSNKQISTTTVTIFSKEANQFDANYRYLERLVKTLLWVKGGFKVIFGGPKELGDKLKKEYQIGGKREFDADFMSNIYEKDFVVDVVDINKVPDTSEESKPMGRHLDGYRIGFDAGGSDRKVSAVVDGKAIYSEEVVWHPKLQSDPTYHYEGIMDSMKTAASKLPRVDAIGVSAAGIYIDNRVAAASLFLQVPKHEFDEYVRDMFLRIAREFDNVPLEVANDGDVTALAGAMNLNSPNILGIAMGTSQAAGYVDKDGYITGWLNELAFAPVDYSIEAMEDEWSHDIGCGVKYFSQDGVIKLAKNAKITLDETLSPAEKLKVIQALLENGDDRAQQIFDSIGIYLGYSIAYYARFYDIKHILLLGRVTSKSGGPRIIKQANNVLKQDFPTLAQQITIETPDEKSRRVGQSIAAASLPKI